MTETMEQLKVQLERLPSQERAELAHFLLCSLEQEVDVDAEAAWEAELARRVADMQSGNVTRLVPYPTRPLGAAHRQR